MTAPNRLAKVLNYCASAYRYAFVKADVRRAMYGALTEMARRDQYVATETMDVDAVMKLAITSAWFYSGVKLISDRICNHEATLQVKKRTKGGLELVRNHPFDRLMERPNSLMTRDFLLAYTTLWYYLNGNAYIFISTESPARGEPEELWPIPANAVLPLPDTLRKSRLTNQPCIDYEYRVNGKAYILNGENMIHIRNPNPFDYWRGLSVISACLQALKSDFEQGRYVEEFYGKDNAIPTAIISIAAGTNEQDFETAKEQIRDEFGSRRRSAIIRAGDFTVQTIAQTLQQSDFINSRKFNASLIHQVIGIPEGLLTGNMSGDSRLATEIAFTRNTVQPLLDRMAGEFTANLAIYYDDDIVISAPSVIPQDRTLKISEYTTYSQDRTINENRKELGLPEIEDLEDETLNRMMKVPVRLIAYVSSNTFQSPEPPVFANNEADPGFGDSWGQMGPDNFMIEETGRALPMNSPVVQNGIKAELQSWKKVAIKEAQHGRNPAERKFVTKAIPKTWRSQISEHLVGADEESIRSVFAEYIKRVEHGAIVPNTNGTHHG